LAKKYYKLGKESLGIRKGKWSIKSMVLISVGMGLGYFLLESVVVGRKLILDQIFITNTLKILLSTFSIGGFLRFILIPVSEEVYFRGFLYSYIKGKLGVAPGLCIQAIIFSFFHLDFFSISSISLLFQRFFGGMLCGIFYEVSGSLYPSIIYHATVNYLIAITLINQIK
jgi:membrane protease YdiL (CAAX protease family)